MKKVLLVAFITFLGISSFANTAKIKAVAEKKSIIIKKDDVTNAKALQAFLTDCTVSVTWKNAKGGTVKLTVKNSCTCTRATACDGAYALLRMVIPGSGDIIGSPQYQELLDTDPGSFDVIPD